MEQLIVIILIALFSFVNWLIKKSVEAREKAKLERKAMFEGEPAAMQPDQPARPPVPGAGGGDESMRKLMEALGLPQDAAPPPVRRQEPAPPPPLPTAVPPVVRKEAPKVHKTLQHEPKTPLQHLQHAPKTLPSHVPKTVSALAKAGRHEPAAAPASSLGIRALLDSPDGAKKAVILSEVLGAPKGLRG